jgi:hypothetical protein
LPHHHRGGDAAGRQIRLEVIEHQKDTFLRQYLPQEFKAQAIINIWSRQKLAPLARCLTV